MITAQNLLHVLCDLKPHEIQDALDDDGDFIELRVSIFNVGSVSHIDSREYSEETEQELLDNGQVFCDKDEFLRMCEEVGLFDIEKYQEISY